MRILKHKLVDIYMLICIIVALVAVFVTVHEYNRTENWVKDVENTTYNYSYYVTVDREYEAEEVDDYIAEIAKNCEVNLILEDIHRYVKERNTTSKVSVIICAKDLSRYDFVSDIPDIDSLEGVPDVIIGQGIKNSLPKGTEYLTIGGKKYKIAGVLGNRKSDFWDSKIYILYNGMDAESKRELSGGIRVSLLAQTDDADKLSEIEKIRDIVNNTNGVALCDISAMSDIVEYKVTYLDTKMGMMFYAFAIVNCLIAVEFWVYARREEIVISKIYGMSNDMIYKRMFLDIMKLCVVASFILLFINILYGIIFGGGIIVSTLIELAMLMVGIPLTTIIISIVPMIIIRKKELYQSLVESGVM